MHFDDWSHHMDATRAWQLTHFKFTWLRPEATLLFGSKLCSLVSIILVVKRIVPNAAIGTNYFPAGAKAVC